MAQIILDSSNNLIQGDFDNATVNNRTKFKTTTTDATTNVYAVPNGSATSAGFSVSNAADPTNASKITIATNGSTDTQIISGINGTGTYLPMSFYTNNTLAMQITTAGNIGVGVTPSAWNSAAKAIDINTYGSVAAFSNQIVSSGNAYFDNAGNWKYKTTAAATNYTQVTGSHQWAVAASGTAGNNITFTQAMTLDSSGNVGIGTASPATKLSVSSADANVIATFANTGATPYGLLTDFTSDPNNATNYGYKFRLTNNTNIYTIFSNGTVSARSDERFKKDIETTRDGYAEDLSKLRVVKYRWHNAEEDSPKELGFIAQEVEQIFPGLISTEMNDDKIDVKSIKISVFVPMLVKAIQEQQTIINDLKARIETLEGAA